MVIALPTAGAVLNVMSPVVYEYEKSEVETSTPALNNLKSVFSFGYGV